MNNMLFNKFKFLCVLGGLMACICVTSCSKETEEFIDGPEKEDPHTAFRQRCVEF